MTVRLTVLSFSLCTWLLCAAPSAFAGGNSADDDTRYTALLLGATSLDILFDRLAVQEDTPTIPFAELPHRIEVDIYISMLGLTDVSYPDDPVASADNPAPLANYGQRIVDQLDEVHRAAFLLGWYGAIHTRTNETPDSSICNFARDADFDTDNCSQDAGAYLSQLLQTARSP